MLLRTEKGIVHGRDRRETVECSEPSGLMLGNSNMYYSTFVFITRSEHKCLLLQSVNSPVVLDVVPMVMSRGRELVHSLSV